MKSTKSTERLKSGKIEQKLPKNRKFSLIAKVKQKKTKNLNRIYWEAYFLEKSEVGAPENWKDTRKIFQIFKSHFSNPIRTHPHL